MFMLGVDVDRVGGAESLPLTLLPLRRFSASFVVYSHACVFLVSWQTKAIFGDGSAFECDVIVACTGYKNTFPFAEETHPDIDEYGQNPRLLYKQVRLGRDLFSACPQGRFFCCLAFPGRRRRGGGSKRETKYGLGACAVAAAPAEMGN